jgi:hypothetical protein
MNLEIIQHNNKILYNNNNKSTNKLLKKYNILNFIDDIESYYTKSWSRLLYVHKVIKLKEYIDSLDVGYSIKIKLNLYFKNIIKLNKLNNIFDYSIRMGKIKLIKHLVLGNII